ncbi:NUDIX domain-containing protein [Candidatus Microgenomates bacterium]|nr:NUDIX domain-containing protein [Candidatus Microgenomates bacterium]
MIKEREGLPTHSTESAIFLLYDPNTNRFLLEERRARFEGDQMAGMWVVPAGKLEPEDYQESGDHFENALVREIGEEFGVVPQTFYFLFVIDHVTPNNHPYRSKIYLVTSWNGEVENKENKHEHEWIPLDEAEERASHWLAKEIISKAKEAIPNLTVGVV